MCVHVSECVCDCECGSACACERVRVCACMSDCARFTFLPFSISASIRRIF